jgi:NH3-dependent NAD+ synthetase
MEKKMTKKEMFEKIMAAMATDVEVVEFCEKEIAALDKKAAKAKEAAAKKREEADELLEVVKSILTCEFQTLGDIAAQIEGEDVSVQKIAARTRKLVDCKYAVKEEVSVVGADGKKTKKMAYKIADCDCEACDE